MRLLTILVLLLTAGFVNGQVRNDYNPYIGVGTSIQNNVVSYGGELGIRNANTWYSATLVSTTSSPENIWSIGGRGNWRVSDRKTSHTVDGYVFTGLRMSLTANHPLTVEPGVAAVWNISNNFAPRISLGFPIEQNAVFRNRPLAISGGLSLNYQIK